MNYTAVFTSFYYLWSVEDSPFCEREVWIKVRGWSSSRSMCPMGGLGRPIVGLAGNCLPEIWQQWLNLSGSHSDADRPILALGVAQGLWKPQMASDEGAWLR